MIAPGLGWAQRQRGRDPESRQGKARQGRGGLGSAQGKEWRRARRGERRNKTPRAHTGSVNHVRLCAIRPSFFPLSSVSSRVFGDVAGAAVGQQGGSWSRCGGHSFFVFFSSFWLYAFALVAVAAAVPVPDGAAAHARGC